MHEILRAVAKLLNIKNVISLIVILAVIGFIYVGKIDAAVLTGLLSWVISYVFSSKSD